MVFCKNKITFNNQQDHFSPTSITMSYQVEWRHLRYFLAVAEELHFKKAADKLYISQPGLSRQIKQMEERLGLPLFERNNKRVQLTPAGKYLHREIEPALKNIENILHHATLIHEGSQGSVKMGYVGSAMQNVIPDLLLRFNKKYPHIHFGLSELDNTKQVAALLAFDLDAGFVRLNEVPPQLNIRPVWRETFSIVLPQHHPMEAKKFKNLSQLKKESFIFFEKSYSPAYHERILSIFEDSGFSPHISHTTVHANTIYRLVENGFGIAIVPTSLQLGYDLPVKFIELTRIPQRAVLSMVWNKKNKNPILGKLLEMMEWAVEE